MNSHQPYLIGIAGGSGSGKTTIALEIQKKLPNALTVHLDDFQKIGSQPEKLNGFDNWEHPSYIDWDLLLQVLKKLTNGESTTILHRNQTHLSESKTKLLVPQEVIIIEGYLLFFHQKVRKLLNTCIFLDASDNTRINRRTKFKNVAYVQHVLLPMHHKYIEQTREYATLVVNTEKRTLEEAVRLILNTMPIPLRD